MSNTHFVTYRPEFKGCDQLSMFKLEAATGVVKQWTISNTAKAGDWVFVYFSKPIARIVAIAQVASTPEERSEGGYQKIQKLRPKRKREFCSDFSNVTILNNPISLPGDISDKSFHVWWKGQPWNSPRRILQTEVREILWRHLAISNLVSLDHFNVQAKAA